MRSQVGKNQRKTFKSLDKQLSSPQYQSQPAHVPIKLGITAIIMGIPEVQVDLETWTLCNAHIIRAANMNPAKPVIESLTNPETPWCS